MQTSRTILFLATALPTLSAQWTEATPAGQPSARRSGAMAFDPNGNHLVIYGGLTATPAQANAETWTYNGQWQLSAATAPARWGHRMVTDTAQSRLIAFGGRSPNVATLSNDTLQFDGSAWSSIPTANAPSPRFLHGMAYDSIRDRVVVFGGRTSQGSSAETWEFDGSDWTLRAPATAPAAREEMGMVFDPVLGAVVLFGGHSDAADTVYGDTWLYDGNNWVEATTSDSPAPRYRHAMAYDTARNRAVVFGGYDGVDTFGTTYEFLGGAWIQVPAGAGPDNRTETFHAYDPQRERMVVFGGFSSSFSNATWEYEGDEAGVFTLFGDACDTVAGTPELSATPPTIGQTLDLTIDNLGSAFGVAWVFGFSNTTYLGLPLPIDLAGLGLPGCDLLVSSDLIDITPATAGAATYPLPVPSQPTLVFESLYVQGLVFDVGAGLTWLGTSRGGRALIGS